MYKKVHIYLFDVDYTDEVICDIVDALTHLLKPLFPETVVMKLRGQCTDI